MTTAAIIVAAGRGSRAGGGVPKQWRSLAGRRVADWTIERFRGQVDHIVLVLSDEDSAAWEEFRETELILAAGGTDRAGSVRNGLAALADRNVQRVLIHDVARPCVTPRIITDVLNALETCPAAAPGLAVTDALWVGHEQAVTGTQDRSNLFAAQTPQGFHYDTITAAHAAHPGGAADDVEVARAAGLDVCIIPGDADNLKITRPEDFARAERIMGTEMDVRLGNGYDVHRFGDGDHVILCGVKVPHDRGLQGHSDADVGMHAVTDAIYGALAQGDIGQHFPPSDPQWKGAASEIFLRHAVELAGQMGYRISNVDCTLVCEYPKIGPHAPAMREKMSEIMDLRADQVSVKATTSERLGFTGRSEGIASLATACLVKA
ncbi:bifunctional 2-C-methyl-D-erythritol 4-phosphate cytidylyltransferase/2-C-methyl-D-erythritol 2,4-cyclodiphosphate synthase [Ruegeria sp. HKCCD6428]|jgi:2-C-methyl-D-erythritol 4-phosphate cytidylyltransferase/2-C-methyl-D-erythritol 2,4-cyclodiphosphate synthase|uniref:bifunctional 2-C-methyl-D-erythritol 4-phosphate cytidylyltransferase/2-C-methyl-D-erythritol 2,4-cyclodiphosphate synthase n=1 Tax=Ruegeria sp. HKCCD6428 TaxID=2683002 RepID=UPI001490C23A|nr:bifunctional 2-C-methyl-D-erythritol 4-phosphate cytidylyltransferase/2-C-methyl-D-erythritol 2,4-cyclodiphosphate synthase [Ruegeria sp. HKCCD6428]NOC82564.1 bifunctional 2-C-methyl-D-erythritol 4-phosphate cytidylyltransferase/2-C-methyl-D-erythritol 2,4-cyclodiphosphate synthase [Ruegeria sp. HKCCD6428]